MPPVRPAAENWDREQLLLEFEQAWQREPPPAIEEFLPAAPPAGAERRAVLEELVKIDLEWRWRRGRAGGAAGPRLEEYAARFPELGKASLALIGEEYRVRQRWGDRPGHAEYLQRFPHHAANLRQSLARLDAQAASEFAVRRGAAPPARPGPGPAGGPTPTCPVRSAAALLGVLRDHQLLNQSQLGELAKVKTTRWPGPRDLAKDLLERGWLTPYQVNQLLQGRGAELVLGPHVLLERLGEGGIGQVYKARHTRMNRVVALKVLRQELLADPEVLGRFSREIQIISQLDHPHIVHAYDAGPIGSAHVLIMEYIEGTNLARLVGQRGCLPPHQACDFIRQAALGLQYAHERGLVHRDIKPSNLMVTQAQGSQALGFGPVKILDLGLARLQVSGANAAVTRQPADSADLTPPGAVLMMGTPDYMAPEQAFDFHGADIRADIYSLGCSLFFLLTGQPPFPGGTASEKLSRHQRAEPAPIQQLRPELPADLIAVLNKMMAKEPRERYRTPGEVAQALAPVIRRTAAPVAVPVLGRESVVTQPRAWMARWTRMVSRRRRFFLGAAGLLAGALMIILLGAFTRPEPVGWTILDPVRFTSEGGATLTKLADRSLLASGKLAPTDSYTITAHTDLVDITALRLELLPHASLPGNGPGRHVAGGNPVLSEIRLLAAPRLDPSRTVPVVLVNPKADFNQENYAVTAAIDGQSETGWAIQPHMGKPHWAVFETRTPVGFPGGTLLIVVLDQRYPEAPLGRFRLSVTKAAVPIRAPDRLPDLD